MRNSIFIPAAQAFIITVAIITLFIGCRKSSAPESNQLLCAFDGKAYAYFTPSWDQAGRLIRVSEADDMCLPIKVRPNAEAVG